jgi:hypothetical protein
MTLRSHWLVLPATALLLASCAAPSAGYDGGYADYAYPGYAYPQDYYTPVYGGFAFGGDHRHFHRPFSGHRFQHRFDRHVGASHGGMRADAEHGSHHR